MSRRLAGPAAGAAPAALGDPADSDGGGTLWPGTDWAAADWAQPGAPLLWRFHLHYWDWAWALAAAPRRRRGRRRRDRRAGVVHRAVDVLAGGGHPRPRRRLAALPRVAARLVLVRPAPAAGGRHPDRAGVHRQPGRARRLPAAAPGDRRRRQPPDQEPQGAGRPGRVLRRRRRCWKPRSAGCGGSWPSRCSRTAAITSGPPPTTARCSPT